MLLGWEESPAAGEAELQTVEQALLALPAEAQEVLSYLGVHRSGVHEAVLASYFHSLSALPPLNGGPCERWRDAVGIARERRLLLPHPASGDAVAIQPAVHQVLLGRLRRVPGRIDLVATAFCATYRALAVSGRLWPPSVDEPDFESRVAFLSVELENVETTLFFMLWNRHPFMGYSRGISDYLRLTGQDERGVLMMQRVLAALDRRPGENHAHNAEVERAVVARAFGEHLTARNRFTEAQLHLDAALAVLSQPRYTGNEVCQKELAFVYERLGNLAYHRGDWRSAMTCLEKQLALPAMEAPSRRALIFMNLGRCASFLGRHEEAARRFQSASEQYRITGDRRGEVNAYADWAHNAHRAGRRQEARAAYRRVLAFSREFGDKKQESVVHEKLAELCREEQHYDAAVRHYLRVMRLAQEISDYAGVANAYGRMGIILAENGAVDVARKCCRRAVRYAKRSRGLHELANQYENAGTAAWHAGRPKVAERFYRKALAIFQDKPHPLFAAGLFANLGHLLIRRRRYTEARAALLAGLRQVAKIDQERLRERLLCELDRLGRRSRDATLIAAIVDVIGESPSKVRELIRKSRQLP